MKRGTNVWCGHVAQLLGVPASHAWSSGFEPTLTRPGNTGLEFQHLTGAEDLGVEGHPQLHNTEASLGFLRRKMM